MPCNSLCELPACRLLRALKQPLALSRVRAFRSPALSVQMHAQPVCTRGSQRLSSRTAEFVICDESEKYHRYLTLYDRRVRFPAYKSKQATEHDFDIIGHPQADFHFSAVFPFHPARNGKPAEVTLIYEYCQGPNQMMYSLPCGSFDKQKHSSYQSCAEHELLEEAELEGGEWVDLLGPDHPGIAEVKWCANRFTPFLCIDPKMASMQGKQDAEEFIETQRISVAELKKVLRSGNMLLPSVTTSYFAMEELQKRGLLS